MMHNREQIPMRFQDRDGLILHAIQEYGGVIAKRQIHDLFWKGKSERAMQKRLSKLHNHRYINWPTLEQRKLNPIPEPIIWLGWKGALQIANKSNLKVDPPKTINENQLRSLELSLRRKGFRWLREPRWTQLNHDLTTIDIRLKIGFDLQELKYLEMGRWINETDFRSNYDRISFTYKDRKGRLRHKKRGVIPDGYFCLLDKKRDTKGLPAKAHFLLEVDMATHDNPSFGIEKAAAGALARYPHLPVKFLIDWEGPANRDDTGGCDASELGHLKEVAYCDDESFWKEREASTFISEIEVPYQRLQSENDHVQPDNFHAILMVNNAVNGGAPWVRLNRDTPNKTYTPENSPAMIPERMDRQVDTLVVEHARELFER